MGREKPRKSPDPVRSQGAGRVNEHGELCFGDSCIKVRIPQQGDLELDLTACPENVQDAVLDRVSRGAATAYKIAGKRTSK